MAGSYSPHRRGERESFGWQSNPRIKRLIRRKPLDFAPRVHLVVGQRCWEEGNDTASGRAPALSRPVKALTRLSTSSFFFFFFFFLLDNRPRLAHRPSLGDEVLLLRALITYGILYETGADRVRYRVSTGSTLFRDDPIELSRVNEKRWKWRVDTDPFALELALSSRIAFIVLPMYTYTRSNVIRSEMAMKSVEYFRIFAAFTTYTIRKIIRFD